VLELVAILLGDLYFAALLEGVDQVLAVDGLVIVAVIELMLARGARWPFRAACRRIVPRSALMSSGVGN